MARRDPPWASELVSNIHSLGASELVHFAATAVSVADRLYTPELAAQHGDGKEGTARVWSDDDCAARVLVWLCRLRMNAVAVTAYRRGASSSIEQVRVALGVFRCTAALNHSCNPNLQLSFRSGTTKLVARARRAIAKGDELTISYGPHVGFSPTEDRRVALKSIYCFECRCEACLAGANGSDVHPLPVKVAAAVATVLECNDMPQTSPSQLSAIVSAGETIWASIGGIAPRREIFSSFDTVARVATACGHVKVGAVWLSRAVAALEAAAGETDVTVGFERVKLAECLLAAGDVCNAKVSAAAAERILRTALGEDHAVVQRELADLFGAIASHRLHEQ